jgi:hypothetical protein
VVAAVTPLLPGVTVKVAALAPAVAPAVNFVTMLQVPETARLAPQVVLTMLNSEALVPLSA